MKLVRLLSLPVAIMLAFSVAAGAWQKQPAKPNGSTDTSNGPHPILVIEAPIHDFGELDSGTPMRHSFKIRNTGTADLVIESVSPSCGCTKGDYDKVVAPGKEGKIELAVANTQGYSGESSKTAAVVTNDPKNPRFTLTLRARFKVDPSAPPPKTKNSSAFNVEPTDRWTTGVLSGSSAASSFYLVNNQTNPVHPRKVVGGGQAFTATIEPIQDGRRYELKVRTAPGLKPGRYTETLRVLTDSPTEPETTLDLELTVHSRVFVTPPSIIMPSLPAASDLSSITWPMIYVRKLREGGLKIKSFTSTLPFLKLELLTESEGQVYKIRLTVDSKKLKPGEFKGTVRIETNDPEAPVLEVPIQGSFS